MQKSDVKQSKRCVRFLLSNVFLAILLLTSSCNFNKTPKTIVPSVVVDTVPSWDGNEQNSGILDFVEGKGWLITPKAAKRYSELSEMYGNMFEPDLGKAEGLVAQEDGNFILPQEYIVKFGLMNQKNKQKPKDGSKWKEFLDTL